MTATHSQMFQLDISSENDILCGRHVRENEKVRCSPTGDFPPLATEFSRKIVFSHISRENKVATTSWNFNFHCKSSSSDRSNDAREVSLLLRVGAGRHYHRFLPLHRLQLSDTGRDNLVFRRMDLL